MDSRMAAFQEKAKILPISWRIELLKDQRRKLKQAEEEKETMIYQIEMYKTQSS